MKREKSVVIQVQSLDAVSKIAPDANKFGDSITTLFRWNRSIYKMLWKHIFCYYIIYVILTIVYKYCLADDGKRSFEAIAAYCSSYTNSINLMIMLGFFTGTAMQRLFAAQMTLPGTAKCTTMFIFSLKPDLPEGPMMVEQYSRWIVLMWILTFRFVCKPLRKIYPDMMSLQSAGILKDEERQFLEQLTNISPPRPLIVNDWLLLLLKEAFNRKLFSAESNYLKNIEAVMAFKKSCGHTIKFATLNIPRAIIQAVIICVYCFGMITLMARNFKDRHHASDVFISYIPLMPGLQFFVYLAFLKLGRAAVNPFGDDEDDINVKHLVQSHFESMLRLRKLYSRNLGDIFPIWQNDSVGAVTVEM